LGLNRYTTLTVMSAQVAHLSTIHFTVRGG